jgi:hypothetical protein
MHAVTERLNAATERGKIALDATLDLAEDGWRNETERDSTLVRCDGQDITGAVEAGQRFAGARQPNESIRSYEIFVLRRPDVQRPVPIQEDCAPSQSFHDLSSGSFSLK